MTEPLLVHPGKLHYFVREIFKRLRVPPKDASKIADVLVAADLAGVEGQGAARLSFHAGRLSARLVNPTPSLEVVEDKAGALTLDGDNGPGPVVGVKAMELAIRRAAKNGIAAVAVRNSNQPGMLGYYARMAVAEQMMGVAMNNDRPTIVPPGGTRPMYGTNPIAMAVPTKEGKGPFFLEFTTSSAGRENYGLGLVVDILSGVLSGGAFGEELTGAEGDHPAVARIGHFFAALRIESFGALAPFRERLDLMLKKLSFSGARGATRVFYPGEREYEAEEERRANGIPLSPPVCQELEGLARRFDLRDAWEHVLASRKGI
ncbi:MAG: Ldh family oxidoreductase [Vicinamibacteria bacterium]